MQTSSAERKAKRSLVDKDLHICNYIWISLLSISWRLHTCIHMLSTAVRKLLSSTYAISQNCLFSYMCFSICVFYTHCTDVASPLIIFIECGVWFQVYTMYMWAAFFGCKSRDLCELRITWILRHPEKEQHDTTQDLRQLFQRKSCTQVGVEPTSHAF